MAYTETKVEKERHLRIKVLVGAYAYENDLTSPFSDSAWDHMAKAINVNIKTGRKHLDDWFKTEFSPHTGQWITSFPEIRGIESLYLKYYTPQAYADFDKNMIKLGLEDAPKDNTLEGLFGD